jgi:succinyl-CoA synthetase alpha subunit
VPVYDAVDEAVRAHPDINASLVSVPRQAAKQAAQDAIRAGRIRLVNILTEGLPRRDAVEILQAADERDVRVVGPSSIGIINPLENIKIGAIGGNDPGIFYPGAIALFSKSGGMCLSIPMEIFNKLGLGMSLVVGIGGDRVQGTTFRDLLELVRDDPHTSLVILNGEIGGSCEEEAAAYIKETEYPKRVVARLTGLGAQTLFPRGARMGHAGAIIGETGTGSYESKAAAFQDAGVPVAKTAEELLDLVERARGRRGPDLDGVVSDEIELVSIAKGKLERLKSQVRAINVRTGLTRIADGMPYFRGYPVTDLIRHASISEMVFMAIRKEDVTHDAAFRLRQDACRLAREFHPTNAVLDIAQHSLRSGYPLQVALSAALLAMDEPSRHAVQADIADRYTPKQIEALALAPQAITLAAHLLGGRADWVGTRGIHSEIFTALTGREASVAEREMTRAIFAACLDHTPATPSSLAALTTYSGGNSLKTALAAGVAAMGHTHAGAGEGAARVLGQFLDSFKQARAESRPLEADGVRVDNLAALASYMVDKVTGVFGDEKQRIPGFGHRYYSTYGSDPRAEALLRLGRELGAAGECCQLAKLVEDVLQDRKSPGLCLNVDGVIGALLRDMGLPPVAAKAMFIIPRCVGILAQLLEQREGAFFRLSNDSVIYTGPGPSDRRRFE